MSAAGQRTQLAFVSESAYGTPGGTTYKALRFTDSGGLNLKADAVQSKEIRADRQLTELRQGFRQVNGDTVHELGLSTFDDLILAAIGASAWPGVAPYEAKGGTALKSFALERGFTDINEYLLYVGCVINELKLSVKPNELVMMTLSWLGKDMSPATTSAATTLTPAASNGPFDAWSGSLQEGGATIADVTSLELSVANNRSVQAVVGQNSPSEVHEGQLLVTGTLSAYFPDATLLGKFLGETESSLMLTLNDPNGTDFHKITLPRIKYTGGDVDNPAEGPIVQSLPFTALLDSVSGTNIIWERSNAT